MNNYVLKHYGKILHIFEPLYRINYYFITAKNWKETKKFIETYFKVDLKPKRDGDKDGYFCVLNKYKTDVGVIWARKNDHINLAHEIMHAVFWAMYERGIDLSFEGEEAFTYLHTFLMRSILIGDIRKIKA